MFKKCLKEICQESINGAKNCAELKFYYCKHCGKIIILDKDTGTPTICCGDEMVELMAGMEDASLEKHVPIVKNHKCYVTVCVGSLPHPMTKEHHIEWIILQTNMGVQKKCLNPEGIPKTIFPLLPDEKVIRVYAFCNLHKLWRN